MALAPISDSRKQQYRRIFEVAGARDGLLQGKPPVCVCFVALFIFFVQAKLRGEHGRNLDSQARCFPPFGWCASMNSTNHAC